MRFLFYVELSKDPNAVAKMMLLIKQGQLTLEGMSFASTDSGTAFSATLTLTGAMEKAEWLAKKLLNFPFFRVSRLMMLDEKIIDDE